MTLLVTTPTADNDEFGRNISTRERSDRWHIAYLIPVADWISRVVDMVYHVVDMIADVDVTRLISLVDWHRFEWNWPL